MKDELQEIYDILMNMQPHIPQCCIDGKEIVIDAYVEKAMNKLEQLINQEHKELTLTLDNGEIKPAADGK